MSWSQYAADWADQYGGYDPRRAPSLRRRWHRFGYGTGRLLVRLRVRPGLLTAAGLAAAAGVPFAAPRGPVGLLIATGLILLSTTAGTLARALGVLTVGISPRMAIREATSDRAGEVLWLVGFWTAGAAVAAVVAAGVLTGLYEYVREQGLGAGMTPAAAQTAGERPTRVSLAVVGMLAAGLAAATGPVGDGLAPGVLTMTVAVWVVVALLGLHQLIGALRRCVP